MENFFVETGQRAVRLVRNGVHSQSWNSGIVQIYYGYSWGNICDDAYLASEEAEVICHQLAYTGVSTYSTTSLDTTLVVLCYCNDRYNYYNCMHYVSCFNC